jgi:hypothetical protein
MSVIRKYLVNLGLRGLTATQKVDKGRNHVSMLTDKPDYPELQAGLPEITAACNDLEASIIEVQFNGGKIAYDRKNVREAELDELLTRLGQQVQVMSFGDKSKILSAGFQVRRRPSPITHMEAPQNLRAYISRRIHLPADRGRNGHQPEHRAHPPQAAVRTLRGAQ